MVDGHGVTVLVVDDEPFVRMDLVDMLEAVGFRTREASSAAEAIEILEQGSEIRVVFTDIQQRTSWSFPLLLPQRRSKSHTSRR